MEFQDTNNSNTDPKDNGALDKQKQLDAQKFQEALSQVRALKTAPQDATEYSGLTGFGVKESKYDKGYNISTRNDIDAYRAESQSGVAQVANRLARLAPAIGLEAIELAGYLGDAPSNIAGALGIIETDYDNAISKWAREASESNMFGLGSEDLPVYRRNSGKVFDWGDPGFYIDSIFDTGESILGFLLLGAGTGAALKAGGASVRQLALRSGKALQGKGLMKKGMESSRAIIKAANMTEKALVNPYVNSAVMANTIGGLNAAQTYKDIYDYAVENHPELSEDEIKELAANNAATTFRLTGIASMLLNVTSLSPFTRNVRGIKLPKRGNRSLNDYHQLLKETLKDPAKLKNFNRSYDWFMRGKRGGKLAQEALQEGTEEVTENFAQHQGMQETQIDLKDPTEGFNIFSPENVLAFTLGSIGGGMTVGATNVYESIANKKKENVAEKRLKQEIDFIDAYKGLQEEHNQLIAERSDDMSPEEYRSIDNKIENVEAKMLAKTLSAAIENDTYEAILADLDHQVANEEKMVAEGIEINPGRAKKLKNAIIKSKNMFDRLDNMTLEGTSVVAAKEAYMLQQISNVRATEAREALLTLYDESPEGLTEGKQLASELAALERLKETAREDDFKKELDRLIKVKKEDLKNYNDNIRQESEEVVTVKNAYTPAMLLNEKIHEANYYANKAAKRYTNLLSENNRQAELSKVAKEKIAYQKNAKMFERVEQLKAEADVELEKPIAEQNPLVLERVVNELYELEPETENRSDEDILKTVAYLSVVERTYFDKLAKLRAEKNGTTITEEYNKETERLQKKQQLKEAAEKQEKANIAKKEAKGTATEHTLPTDIKDLQAADDEVPELVPVPTSDLEPDNVPRPEGDPVIMPSELTTNEAKSEVFEQQKAEQTVKEQGMFTTESIEAIEDPKEQHKKAKLIDKVLNQLSKKGLGVEVIAGKLAMLGVRLGKPGSDLTMEQMLQMALDDKIRSFENIYPKPEAKPAPAAKPTSKPDVDKKEREELEKKKIEKDALNARANIGSEDAKVENQEDLDPEPDLNAVASKGQPKKETVAKTNTQSIEAQKAEIERRRQELESSREIETLYDLRKPITEDSKEVISKIEEANKLRKDAQVKSEQAAKETNEEKRIALNSDANSLNEKAQILDKEVKTSRDSVINNTPIKKAITSAWSTGQKLLNKIKLAAKSNEWVSSMPISKEEFTKLEEATKRLSVKNMGEVTSNSEVIPDILLIEEINAKYDAELKALEESISIETVEVEVEVEVEKTSDTVKETTPLPADNVETNPVEEDNVPMPPLPSSGIKLTFKQTQGMRAKKGGLTKRTSRSTITEFFHELLTADGNPVLTQYSTDPNVNTFQDIFTTNEAEAYNKDTVFYLSKPDKVNKNGTANYKAKHVPDKDTPVYYKVNPATLKDAKEVYATDEAGELMINNPGLGVDSPITLVPDNNPEAPLWPYYTADEGTRNRPILAYQAKDVKDGRPVKGAKPVALLPTGRNNQKTEGSESIRNFFNENPEAAPITLSITSKSNGRINNVKEDGRSSTNPITNLKLGYVKTGKNSFSLNADPSSTNIIYAVVDYNGDIYITDPNNIKQKKNIEELDYYNDSQVIETTKAKIKYTTNRLRADLSESSGITFALVPGANSELIPIQLQRNRGLSTYKEAGSDSEVSYVFNNLSKALDTFDSLTGTLGLNMESVIVTNHIKTVPGGLDTSGNMFKDFALNYNINDATGGIFIKVGEELYFINNLTKSLDNLLAGNQTYIQRYDANTGKLLSKNLEKLSREDSDRLRRVFAKQLNGMRPAVNKALLNTNAEFTAYNGKTYKNYNTYLEETNAFTVDVGSTDHFLDAGIQLGYNPKSIQAVNNTAETPENTTLTAAEEESTRQKEILKTKEEVQQEKAEEKKTEAGRKKLVQIKKDARSNWTLSVDTETGEVINQNTGKPVPEKIANKARLKAKYYTYEVVTLGKTQYAVVTNQETPKVINIDGGSATGNELKRSAVFDKAVEKAGLSGTEDAVANSIRKAVGSSAVPDNSVIEGAIDEHNTRKVPIPEDVVRTVAAKDKLGVKLSEKERKLVEDNKEHIEKEQAASSVSFSKAQERMIAKWEKDPNLTPEQVKKKKDKLAKTNKKFEKLKNDPNEKRLREIIPALRYKKIGDDEVAWFKEMIGSQYLNVAKGTDRVLEQGKEAWGYYHNAMVTVAEAAQTGTLYHEAFHMIFELSLTDKQKKALYAEASKESKIKIDNLEALDEYMANKFMDFKFSPESQAKGTKMSRFFNSILNYIRNLLGMKMSMDKLFQNISEGNFDKRRLRKRIKNLEKFAPNNVRHRIVLPNINSATLQKEAIETLKYELVQLNNSQTESLKDIRKIKRSAINNLAKKGVLDKLLENNIDETATTLEEAPNLITRVSLLLEESYDVDESTLTASQQKDLIITRKVFEDVIDNWGNPTSLLGGVKFSHMLIKSLNDNGYVTTKRTSKRKVENMSDDELSFYFEQELLEDNPEYIYDKAFETINPKQTISNGLRRFLSFVPELQTEPFEKDSPLIKIKEETVTDKNGREYKVPGVRKNMLGRPKFIAFDKVYTQLNQAFADRDTGDIYATLEELAKRNPILASVKYQLDAYIQSNGGTIAEFESNFNQSNINFLSIEVSGKKNTVKSPNRNKVEYFLRDSWQSLAEDNNLYSADLDTETTINQEKVEEIKEAYMKFHTEFKEFLEETSGMQMDYKKAKAAFLKYAAKLSKPLLAMGINVEGKAWSAAFDTAVEAGVKRDGDNYNFRNPIVNILRARAQQVYVSGKNPKGLLNELVKGNDIHRTQANVIERQFIKLQAPHVDNLYLFNAAFIGGDKKNKFARNLPNTISNKIAAIKKDPKKALADFNKDPFYNPSSEHKLELLDRLENDPEFREEFLIYQFETVRNAASSMLGKSYSETNSKDAIISNLTLFLNNATSNIIGKQGYINTGTKADKRMNNFGLFERLDEDGADIKMYSQMMQEVKRVAMAFKEGVNNDVKNYKDRAKTFVYFPLLNDMNLERITGDPKAKLGDIALELQSLASGKNIGTADGKIIATLKKEIQEVMIPATKQLVVNNTLARFENTGMLTLERDKNTGNIVLENGYYKVKTKPDKKGDSLFDDAFPEEFKKDAGNLVKVYTLNSLLWGAEVNMLFSGDAAYQKDLADFFKRAYQTVTPGKVGRHNHDGRGGSTRKDFTLAITDDVYKEDNIEVVKNLLDNIYPNSELSSKAYINKIVNDLKKPKKERKYTPNRKTSPNEVRAYNIINNYINSIKTDAQVYMTMDMYIDYLKGFDLWSSNHNMFFNNIWSNKAFDRHLKEDGKPMSYAEIIEKAYEGEIPWYKADGTVQKIEKDSNKTWLKTKLNQYNSTFMEPLKPFYFSNEFNSERNKVMPLQIKMSVIPISKAMAYRHKGLQDIKDKMENAEGGPIDVLAPSSAIKTGEFKKTSLENLGTKADGKITLPMANLRLIHEQHTKEEQDQIAGTQLLKILPANLSGEAAERFHERFNGAMVAKIKNSEDGLKTRLGYSPELVGKMNLGEWFTDSSAIDQELFINRLADLLSDEVDRLEASQNYEEALEIVTNARDELEFVAPLDFPIFVRKFESIINSVFRNNIMRQTMKVNNLVQSANFAVDDDLKYTRVENGKVMPAEIAIPEHMAVEIMGVDFLSELEANGGIPDKYKDDPRLEMLGYRVPYSSRKLSSAVRAVKVLPAGYSNVMVSPELAIQMGSDYDVDKLNLIRKEIDDKTKELVIYDEKSTDFSKLSDKQLNNIALDEMLKVLKDPTNLASIVTPLTTDILKERSAELRELFELDTLGSEHITSPDTNLLFEELNKFGKFSIGTAANFSTAIVLLERIQAKVRLQNSLVEDGNEFDGNLKGGLNFKGEPIIDTMELWQNAFLDNAKDLTAGYMNVNDMTLNPLMAMVSMGYSNDTAIDMLNQPIIRELYTEFQKTGNTNFKEAFKKVRKRGKVPANEFNKLFGRKAQNVKITSKELEKGVQNKSFDEMTAKEQLAQLRALKMFEELYNIGFFLNKMTSILKPDGAKNLTSQAKILEYNEKMFAFASKLNPVHFDVNRVMQIDRTGNEDPFKSPVPRIAAMYMSAIKGNLAFSDRFFPYDTGSFRLLRARVTNQLGYTNLNAEQIEAVNNAVVYMLASRAFENTIDNEAYDWDALLYEGKLVEQYRDLIKNQPELEDDPLFQAIRPESNNKYALVKKIFFDNANNRSATEKNDITDAWFQHLNSSKNPEVQDFARKLVGYAIKTTGMAMTKKSFVELIPLPYLQQVNFISDYVNEKGDPTLENNINLLDPDFLEPYVNQVIRSLPFLMPKVPIVENPEKKGEYISKEDAVIKPTEKDFNKTTGFLDTVKLRYNKNDVYQRKDISKPHKGIYFPVSHVRIADIRRTSKGYYDQKNSMVREYQLVDFNLITNIATYKEIQPLGEYGELKEASMTETDPQSKYPKFKNIPVTPFDYYEVKQHAIIEAKKEGSDKDYDGTQDLEMLDDDEEDSGVLAALADTEQQEDVNPELEAKLREFAAKAGFGVAIVDNIKERLGVDAVGAADMLNKMILLSNSEAGLRALPEEVAHVYVEALGDHKAMQRLLDAVEGTEEFAEVLRKYSEVYGNDLTKLKKEAAGKIIAKYLMQEGNKPPKNWLVRKLQNVLALIKRVFGKADPFKMAAQDILNLKVRSKGPSFNTNPDTYYNLNEIPDDNSAKPTVEPDLAQIASLKNKEAALNQLKPQEFFDFNAEVEFDINDPSVLTKLNKGYNIDNDVEINIDDVAKLGVGRDPEIDTLEASKVELEQARKTYLGKMANMISRLKREGQTKPNDIKELETARQLLRNSDALNFANVMGERAAADVDIILKEMMEFNNSLPENPDRLNALNVITGLNNRLTIFSELTELAYSLSKRTFNMKEALAKDPDSLSEEEQKLLPIYEATAKYLMGIVGRVDEVKKIISSKEAALFKSQLIFENKQSVDEATKELLRDGYLKATTEEDAQAEIQKFVDEAMYMRESDIGWLPSWATGLHEHNDKLLGLLGNSIKIAEGKAHNNYTKYLRGYTNEDGKVVSGGVQANEELIKLRAKELGKPRHKLTRKDIYGEFLSEESFKDKFTGKLKTRIRFIGPSTYTGSNKKHTLDYQARYQAIMALPKDHPKRVFYEVAIKPYIDERTKLKKQSWFKINKTNVRDIPAVLKKDLEGAMEAVATSNFKEVKEGTKNAFVDTFSIAKDNNDYGLIDDDGLPIKSVPYHYNNKSVDSKDISLDIFSSLQLAMDNIYTSNEYQKVLPLFKVALNILAERKIAKAIDVEGETESGIPTFISKYMRSEREGKSSYAYQKVEALMNMLIFGENKARELEIGLKYRTVVNEDGTVTKVPTKKVEVSKINDAAKKLFTYIGLALNPFSIIMNPAVQLYFAVSKAIGGDIYTLKDLFTGYKELAKNFKGMTKDFMNPKAPKNKLVLLLEQANILGNDPKSLKYGYKNSTNFFSNFFTKLGYSGYKMGNAMVQPSIAVAMMKKKKFKLKDGSTIDFVEAHSLNSKGGLEIHPEVEAQLNAEFKNNGVVRFQNTIQKEVTRVSDIHRMSDKGRFQKNSFGRLMGMHRSWMVPLYLNLWGGFKDYDPITGKPEEGVYRTLVMRGGFIQRMVKAFNEGGPETGGKTLGWIKNTMMEAMMMKANDANYINNNTGKPYTEAEVAMYRANMKQALSQLVFLAATGILSIGIKEEDKKDSHFYYLLLRLRSEAFAALDPNEMLATLRSPTAAFRSLENIMTAMTRLVGAADGYSEVESGYWKGYKKVTRDWIKLTPGLNQYHSWQHVEDKIKFLTTRGR